MEKKLNSSIGVALYTGAALIAFALEQRYAASGMMSGSASDVAAAIICLFPVAYGLVRRKACRNNSPHRG